MREKKKRRDERSGKRERDRGRARGGEGLERREVMESCWREKSAV